MVTLFDVLCQEIRGKIPNPTNMHIINKTTSDCRICRWAIVLTHNVQYQCEQQYHEAPLIITVGNKETKINTIHQLNSVVEVVMEDYNDQLHDLGIQKPNHPTKTPHPAFDVTNLSTNQITRIINIMEEP